MWILIFDAVGIVLCAIAIIYAMVDDDRKRWEALHPKVKAKR